MSAKTAIHMEKLLGWASKLGREESLEISKASQTVLDRLMASTSLLALWGKCLEKGQWPLLALMQDTSVPPCVPLVPFKLLPLCWSSEGVSLTR